MRARSTRVVGGRGTQGGMLGANWPSLGVGPLRMRPWAATERFFFLSSRLVSAGTERGKKRDGVLGEGVYYGICRGWVPDVGCGIGKKRGDFSRKLHEGEEEK